jgi:hypothetical protein
MRLDSAKHSKFRSQNLKVKDQLEDLGVDESTILKWTITKYGWRAWTRFMTRDKDQRPGSYERGNEYLHSIKGVEFLVYPSDYQLLLPGVSHRFGLICLSHE